MEEGSPVIYGLEYQARCLAPQIGETERIRFVVGSQSLRSENHIDLLEYNEDSNTIYRTVYPHEPGELWQLALSPVKANLMASVYNSVKNGKLVSLVGLWTLSEEFAVHSQDDFSNSQDLGVVESCLDTNKFGEVKSVAWHPSSGDVGSLVVATPQHLLLWDLGKGSPILSGQMESSKKSSNMVCRWNPHRGGSLVACVTDHTFVDIWDVRAFSLSHNIEVCKRPCVRDVDWNPNMPHLLVSGDDSGKVNIWDLRKSTSPLVSHHYHSHWVWNVRYNACHDQLLLSCGSDAKVFLHNFVSVSSEPYGSRTAYGGDSHSDEESGDNSNESRQDEEAHRLETDCLLNTFENHEDISIYCVEWSSVEPWLFASLSYDGCFIINRVPRNIKYTIML